MSESSMIVADQKPAAPKTPLGDLRANAMSVPVAVAQQGLAEYKDRRDNFRAWLLPQLKEGTHFGYPPGCEPKWCDANGRLCHRDEAVGTLGYARGSNVFVSFASWMPKPSMYAAGVDFIVELMNLNVQYAPDLEGWKMFGSKEGTCVYSCKLFSNETGALIGEGRGFHSCIDSKGNVRLGDGNKAIKMSMKSAKMCAVLDAYGLRDLFTQDLEDKKPPRENPEADEAAPTAPTRAERATQPAKPPPCSEVVQLWKLYSSKFPYEQTAAGKKKATGEFNAYIAGLLGRKFDLSVAENWRDDEFDRCMADLKSMEGGS